MSFSLVAPTRALPHFLFLRRGSEDTEVSTLRPNVRTTGQASFEELASTFAFDVSGSRSPCVGFPQVHMAVCLAKA